MQTTFCAQENTYECSAAFSFVRGSYEREWKRKAAFSYCESLRPLPKDYDLSECFPGEEFIPAKCTYLLPERVTTCTNKCTTETAKKPPGCDVCAAAEPCFSPPGCSADGKRQWGGNRIFPLPLCKQAASCGPCFPESKCSADGAKALLSKLTKRGASDCPCMTSTQVYDQLTTSTCVCVYAVCIVVQKVQVFVLCIVFTPKR